MKEIPIVTLGFNIRQRRQWNPSWQMPNSVGYRKWHGACMVPRRVWWKLLQPSEIKNCKMQTYTINTFADSINDVGLSKGSNLMIHSSLMHLGHIWYQIKRISDKIFECISQRIGEEGTIYVAAFTITDHTKNHFIWNILLSVIYWEFLANM